MKNLQNYKIKNKKVLLRADLNVPVVDGLITDNSRIMALKSSIRKLISNKNKIFILSHFGRPNGKYEEKYSLQFILPSLKEVFQINKIHFLKNLNKENINTKVLEMKRGEVCLIENIRFYKSEEKIDLNFAKNLSDVFDVYVNDAFSVSHRNHTSIIGFPNFLPAVAGDHFVEEIKNINLFLNNIKKTKYCDNRWF